MKIAVLLLVLTPLAYLSLAQSIPSAIPPPKPSLAAPAVGLPKQAHKKKVSIIPPSTDFILPVIPRCSPMDANASGFATVQRCLNIT
jgi:hypothetical protein